MRLSAMNHYRHCHQVILLCLLLGAQMTQQAQAHHGFLLYFDPSDQVRLEGVLHRLKIRNPHSELQIAVETEGKTDIWACETQARAVLMRKGLNDDSLRVGDPITVVGSRGREGVSNGENRCQISSAALADGRVIELRSAAGIASVGVRVGTATPVVVNSIFGRWIRTMFVGEPTDEGLLNNITEAGRIANANYDPFTQDPPLLCKPGSPPRAWVAPGQPSEIRQEQNRIIIQHEFMDSSRVIHMNGRGRPEAAAASEMGYSVGRLVGNELVVESTRFLEGPLLTHVGDSGLMHSDQLVLTETYRANPETGELEYSWRAEDAKYFSAAITGQFAMTPTTLEIGEFNCEILLSK